MRDRDDVILIVKMVVAVVFSPVLLPVGLAYVAVQDRRKRIVAKSFPCITCGRVLGAMSVKLADDSFHAQMEEWRRENPHRMLRMAERTCHAICVGCGTRYTYCEEDRTFTLEPPLMERDPVEGIPSIDPS